jgi:two-component system cell cycle response regulator DivK
MSGEFPITYNWQKKTFLIVEDDESSSFLLNEILKDTGANLLFANSSAKALKIVEQNPALDLILLDIQLPDKDGYQTCREIHEVHPNIPIMAQTAFAFDSDKNKALRYGCNDFIAKPLYPIELQEKIQKILDK